MTGGERGVQKVYFLHVRPIGARVQQIWRLVTQTLLLPLEEEERHGHDSKQQPEIDEWENEPAAVIDTISRLSVSPLIELTDDKINHHSCAHNKETEVQYAVH